MTELSVVIPVYNEEGNAGPLMEKIRNTMSESNIDYEVIYVDDGSADRTAERIRSGLREGDTLIRLSTNCGQTPAIRAGVDIAKGRYIATLDGDLQNDPSDLPVMLDVIREKKCDIVTGIRADRQDAVFLKKFPSQIANFLVRLLIRTDIKDNGCGIKIFRSEIIRAMPLYGERHRFIVTMAALEGASVEQVAVRHFPRIHGKSKYGMGRTLKVLCDIILMRYSRKYSQKPLYLFGGAGIVSMFTGLIMAVVPLFGDYYGGSIWSRSSLVPGLILILLGFQVISTGLVLESFIRHRFESGTARPYRVREIIHHSVDKAN